MITFIIMIVQYVTSFLCVLTAVRHGWRCSLTTTTFRIELSFIVIAHKGDYKTSGVQTKQQNI